MKFYTIGYGGRNHEDFISLLKQRGIKTIVDVRLYPDRAYSGKYKKTGNSKIGIQGLLSMVDIDYISLIELGNIFKNDKEEWPKLYKQFLGKVGDIVIERLMNALESHPEHYCLMCCEKKSVECHRKIIADYLVKQGHEVEHIE
jgi:uncharacterized protein (DUF488 family)